MDHAEIMHILQTTRNTGQLNSTSARPPQGTVTTHELNTVHVPVPFNKLVDVSVVHPLRNQSKPVFAYRHSEQR